MAAYGESVRVVLAMPAPHRLAGLGRVIAAAGDMVFKEICEQPRALGRICAQMLPDVVVCYCPVYTEDMRLAIKAMLDGSRCNVLILTPRPIMRDPALDQRRMGMLVMGLGHEGPQAVQQYSDVLTQIRSQSAAKRRLFPAPGAAGALAAEPLLGEKSVALPESVLNKYIIAIGSSTGGPEALTQIFKKLPARLPGIVVVQHMPKDFTKSFSERLNKELPFTVTEGAHGVRVTPGSIHIAPGSNHMTVRRQGTGWVTEIGGIEKVGNHCPAVDVLFESVAQHAPNTAVGIILTGMGQDGAKGMLNMRRRGAFTIGQDEQSCVVYGMPRKAFEFGGVVKQAPLGEIPRTLLGFLSRAR